MLRPSDGMYAATRARNPVHGQVHPRRRDDGAGLARLSPLSAGRQRCSNEHVSETIDVIGA